MMTPKDPRLGSIGSRPLSRRTILRLMAAAGAGSALAGRPGLRRGAAQEASPPADAAPQQVLRAATGSTGAASFTFTPMLGGGDQQNWQTLMWMPPMYFDVNLQLQPGVFQSWEANPESTVWTFRLDPRGKWSDNTPITAADVKGTWELMADPLTEHGRIVGYIGNVDGFAAVRDGTTTDMTGLQAVDAGTLQVTLTKPDPVFHWRIATTHMNPVKAEQARGNVAEFWRPENQPAVSGPFMLEAYDPDGGTAEVVRNPNWWLGEGPYLERISFRFVTDQQVLGALAQNDEIDCSLAPLPLALAPEFPDFFRPIESIGFNTFWFNVSADPTSDVNVRKALTLAVNFEDVFKAAYPEGGGAVRPNQIIDSALPCLAPDATWYQYDPEGAKAALAATSFGSGDRLPKLRVTPRGETQSLQRALETILEFWRQNLGITNVEFKARPEEFGPDETKVNVSRDDVVIRFPDSATYMWAAAHSTGPIANAEGDMLRGYKNEQVDSLLDQALATPLEDPRRCELTLEAQRLFMEDYPLLLVGDEDLTLNARDYVKNYEKGPDTTLIAPWRIYLAAH